jgi:HAD superfamily hydrolase (TIGR01548 family)
MDWMWRVGQPFPMARPTLELLEGLLAAGAEPEPGRVERVRRERAALAGLLAGLGAEPLPSQANFVLARFADAPWVRTAMAALGVAVRGFPGRAELDGWLRTTLPGSDAAFTRLAAAFRTVLRPEALLLDLDGVVADESESYHRSVVETAARYGVALTTDEVSAAKAAGHANNDWQLTTRLLAERGVEASLEEVTERFEALYQGTPEAPGLCHHERLLVDPETVRRLAARLPLAVVTCRPRRDAERFLSDHGLADAFSAVVTMEDAPIKPDPAPVRLALERLGTRHAWMVGDTPDDVRAARAADVLPLGVLAPQDEPGRARAALAGAGAARILDRLDDLLEMLP